MGGSMIVGPSVRWGHHYRPVGRGSTTITTINNNYSARTCGGGCGMSWLGSLMMLPMLIMPFIPFFGMGRNRGAEQQQQVQPQQQPDQELTNLNKLYGDKYNIVKNPDGTFTAAPKAGGPNIDGTDYNDLKQKISEAGTKASVEKGAGQNTFTKDEALGIIKGAGLENKITIDDDGKIKYTAPGATEETVLEGLTTSNVGKAIAAFNAESKTNVDGPKDEQQGPDDVQRGPASTVKSKGTVKKSEVEDKPEPPTVGQATKWTMSKEDKWYSGDMVINAGDKNYKIIDDDDDNLNIGKFTITENEGNRHIQVKDGYKATQLKDLETGKSMKLQQMKNGSLYIVLKAPAGQFVKLEDFLSLGLQNAPKYQIEKGSGALLPVASKPATETPKEPGRINLPTLKHSKTT